MLSSQPKPSLGTPIDYKWSRKWCAGCTQVYAGHATGAKSRKCILHVSQVCLKCTATLSQLSHRWISIQAIDCAHGSQIWFRLISELQLQGDIVPLYSEHGEFVPCILFSFQLIYSNIREVIGYICKPQTRLEESTMRQSESSRKPSWANTLFIAYRMTKTPRSRRIVNRWSFRRPGRRN